MSPVNIQTVPKNRVKGGSEGTLTQDLKSAEVLAIALFWKYGGKK